ncbi:1,2-phenylacetyl-CoA epoxidase subunit PaaE [Govanella unica]|uniref:Phenylacetate-CoA oxygenase/reductase subunit PaaK n=1 Tax=Govanella unica TaxID=2975056 RepID=A0A9X3TZR9_9PROT|nr:1,2-phenylacetyl-CoA epoxidase subunit PaaE [Govania unica]MDA5194467.1 phenylacetate-CoA oxygenase/reductase subunit PaaK [Govania unica]
MVQFHRLTIADLEKQTDDSIAVTFAVPDNLRDDYRFIQGQHLTLRSLIDGKDVRRSYSICSGVDDNQLRVAIKQIPDGIFSSYANSALTVGSELEVMTPMGKFSTPLDPAQAKTYVAFAAGSGITPMLSIIKTTLAREPNSNFHLFFGNRSVASIMFREELEDIKNRHMTRFSVTNILSREAQDIDILMGRIDGKKAKALLAALCPVSQIDDVFLCGPQAMIEDVSKTLIELGMSKDHIHFELFYTDDAPRAAARPIQVESKMDTSRVTVIVHGISTEFNLAFNGGTVLDAAETHGADVPFSCKGGVCCTCRAKVIEGKVDMAVNYALEPHEVEAGFVLTCQSRPLTDKVVLDYDA